MSPVNLRVDPSFPRLSYPGKSFDTQQQFLKRGVGPHWQGQPTGRSPSRLDPPIDKS